MNSNELVSVIVPFLNAEKFLQETIASVFAQTYEDWQLLLVDDGSTDGSPEIARECAKEYPEGVHYFDHDEHQNKGVCCSRNLGLRKAGGEYIALLDADDVWLPDKLERQVAILRAHPAAGLVFGASQYWVSWTGKTEELNSDRIPELGVEPNTLFFPPRAAFAPVPVWTGKRALPL